MFDTDFFTDELTAIIDRDKPAYKIESHVLRLIEAGADSPKLVQDGLLARFGTVDRSHVATAYERLAGDGLVEIDDSGFLRKLRRTEKPPCEKDSLTARQRKSLTQADLRARDRHNDKQRRYYRAAKETA